MVKIKRCLAIMSAMVLACSTFLTSVIIALSTVAIYRHKFKDA